MREKQNRSANARSRLNDVAIAQTKGDKIHNEVIRPCTKKVLL